MTSWRKILFVVCAVVAICSGAVVFVYATSMVGTKVLTRETLVVKNHILTAEIANTPSGRITGLSGRTDLQRNDAMLFVFPEDASHGFWMKDMNFPIDMIWLDASLRVVAIVPSVSPDTYPKIFEPSVPSRYVLETNAGFAARVGLQKGDDVSIVQKAS